ncbi:hypothetical protein Halar_1198 [halophilic archaeon DL31]|nr:hypothetical protein Halar_1198 [halophilic archaeon DL31]
MSLRFSNSPVTVDSVTVVAALRQRRIDIRPRAC